jgi:hypothetical protein
MKVMLVLVGGFLSVSLALWSGCLGHRMHPGMASPPRSSGLARASVHVPERSGMTVTAARPARISTKMKIGPTGQEGMPHERIAPAR